MRKNNTTLEAVIREILQERGVERFGVEFISPGDAVPDGAPPGVNDPDPLFTETDDEDDVVESERVEEILRRVIHKHITEELIGNKGGVNYYQMGGSIKNPALYNLDSSGRPTRDPGIPGLKRRRKTKKRKK
ncbi:MAG: hypothetical protein EBZ49_02740 [Proteobacteria bacterium]|nr:hypothetical protein [Pseudomonadota bacterium]